MGRGFFAGSLWGGVIGIVTIALTSQLADWRDLSPAVTDTEAPVAPVVTSGEELAPEVPASGDAGQAGGEAVALTEDVSDDAPGTPEPLTAVEADADGADQSEAPSATGAGSAPSASEDAAFSGTDADVAEAPEPDAAPAPGDTPAIPEVAADAPVPATPAADQDTDAADIVITTETTNGNGRAVVVSGASEPSQPDSGAVAPTDVPARAPDIEMAALDRMTAPGEGSAPRLSAAEDLTPLGRTAPLADSDAPDAPVSNGLDAPAAPAAAAAPLPGPAPRPSRQGDAPNTTGPAPEVSALGDSEGLSDPATPADQPEVSTAPPAPQPAPEAEETAETIPSEPEVAETDAETGPSTEDDAAVKVSEAQEDTPAPSTGGTSDEMAETEEIEAAEEPATPPASAGASNDGTEVAAAPAEMPRIRRVEDNTVGNLIDRTQTNRLPTIGATDAGAEAEEAETAEITDDGAVEEAAPEPDTALARFAQAFEVPEGKPLLSVVLVHTGGDASALAQLPVPVSFAVEAARPDAAEIARAYRAAGREVVLIPNLPQRATPGDVEQALQINFQDIPEAVALMDSPDASFQADRFAMAQVVEAAAETGHGLVTFPRGLNSAQQMADRASVAAGLVFRDIDARNATRGAISRSLDQAGLRAGQESRVILVGRTAPDTITALVDWSQSNRAEAVTLAPLSALLLAK